GRPHVLRRGRAVRAGRGVAHRAGTPQRAPLRAARAAQPGDRRDGASHGTRAPSAAVLPATPARRVRGARGCLGGGAAAAPELQTPDSPTHRVGAPPAGAFKKHRHLVPMLSLANAFNEKELAEWEERNARLSPEVKTGGYTLEVKIDGAAVSLTYQDGMFVT